MKLYRANFVIAETFDDLMHYSANMIDKSFLDSYNFYYDTKEQCYISNEKENYEFHLYLYYKDSLNKNLLKINKKKSFKITKSYYQINKLHSLNNHPALVCYYNSGRVNYSFRYDTGELGSHCFLPCYEFYSEYGTITDYTFQNLLGHEFTDTIKDFLDYNNISDQVIEYLSKGLYNEDIEILKLHFL